MPEQRTPGFLVMTPRHLDPGLRQATVIWSAATCRRFAFPTRQFCQSAPENSKHLVSISGEIGRTNERFTCARLPGKESGDESPHSIRSLVQGSICWHIGAHAAWPAMRSMSVPLHGQADGEASSLAWFTFTDDLPMVRFDDAADGWQAKAAAAGAG